MSIQQYRILSLVFILTILFNSLSYAQTDEQPVMETKNEEKIQTNIPGNMLNSLFGIYLFGGIGFPFGAIMDAEHDLSYATVQYSDGTIKTGRPDHMLYYYGINGDVYLYSSKSIKTGIRVRFLKGIIRQETTVGGGKYETKNYNATLMDFNAPMVGASLIWSPFSHRNVGFTSFVTIGKLIYSNIKPMPTLQKENSSAYPLPKKSYDVQGYVINAGIGAQYAFSTIILGMNLVYSQFYISIDGNPYSSLGSKNASNKTNIYAVSLEMFAGVHF